MAFVSTGQSRCGEVWNANVARSGFRGSCILIGQWKGSHSKVIENMLKIKQTSGNGTTHIAAHSHEGEPPSTSPFSGNLNWAFDSLNNQMYSQRAVSGVGLRGLRPPPPI